MIKCLNYLIASVLITFYSCAQQNESGESCAVDYNLVNRYVYDLNTLMNKESGDLYFEALNAYIRLEAITKSTNNTDSLYHLFTTDINNRTKMSATVAEYVDWLAANKCLFTMEDANQAFALVNDNIERPDYNSSDYLKKLRLKNGLAEADTSKDEDLIKTDSLRYESMKLQWETNAIFPPEI